MENNDIKLGLALIAILGTCVSCFIWLIKSMQKASELRDKVSELKDTESRMETKKVFQEILGIFKTQDERHQEDRQRWHDMINTYFTDVQLQLAKIQSNQDATAKVLEKLVDRLNR